MTCSKGGQVKKGGKCSAMHWSVLPAEEAQQDRSDGSDMACDGQKCWAQLSRHMTWTAACNLPMSTQIILSDLHCLTWLLVIFPRGLSDSPRTEDATELRVTLQFGPVNKQGVVGIVLLPWTGRRPRPGSRLCCTGRPGLLHSTLLPQPATQCMLQLHHQQNSSRLAPAFGSHDSIE